MLTPVRYHFTQIFSAPAREAFAWCTNFTSDDRQLMGEADGKRRVTHLAEGTIILADTFYNDGKVEKRKLVHLYPETLSWVSTHLSGPNKYSQFIYKISQLNECESKLDFYGLHIENVVDALSDKDLRKLAKKLRETDSHVWKLLAKAMLLEL